MWPSGVFVYFLFLLKIAQTTLSRQKILIFPQLRWNIILSKTSRNIFSRFFNGMGQLKLDDCGIAPSLERSFVGSKAPYIYSLFFFDLHHSLRIPQGGFGLVSRHFITMTTVGQRAAKPSIVWKQWSSYFTVGLQRSCSFNPAIAIWHVQSSYLNFTPLRRIEIRHLWLCDAKAACWTSSYNFFFTKNLSWWVSLKLYTPILKDKSA